MKEDLEKLIQFYKTIVDLSHSAIAAIDQEGRIFIANKATADFFGLPLDQVVGRLVTEVNPNEPGLLRVLAEQNVQLDDLRKVGSRTIITNRAPIYYEGQLIGAISSLRDITELQQYEEAMRRKMSRQGLQAKWSLDDMVANSEPMESICALAKIYSEVDSTVLLLGESGTGKEMLAQGIHLASPRKAGPFVALNCAALPESLLESELFGYEEGSFTGARKGGKPGLFELAHRGTIFLDEIGELPLLLQSRLLRVLQEREVMRIGGNKVIPVDVRVIAATNRDLVSQMRERLFREDLYFRLAILVLQVPPLRERIEDIPWLVKNFLRDWRKEGKLQLTDEDIQRLQSYSWPGNVRELRNFIERALVLVEAGKALDLFDSNLWFPADTTKRVSRHNSNVNQTEEYEMEDEDEEKRIRRVLKEERGNMGRAAKRLGMHRSTLWRKLKRHSTSDLD